MSLKNSIENKVALSSLSSDQMIEAEKFQTVDIVTLSTVHCVHDTYQAFLSPFLPILINTLSITKTEAGFLAVFQQWPSILNPFIGHFFDRYNLRFLIVLAPAITSVVMSLTGVLPNYWMVAILMIIAGISSASIHAVGPVMIGAVSGKTLGKGTSFWMVGGELGRALGPIIIVSVITYFSLQATPWLMVAGIVTSLILFLRLRKIGTLNSRPSVNHNELDWHLALSRMWPFMLPMSGLLLFYSFLVASATTFLPTYLIQEGSNLFFAGLSLTILEAAAVAGAFFGGSISDKIGRRHTLFLSLIFSPILMILFLQVSNWMRYILLVLIGVAAFAISPVIIAMVLENFPENKALANGLYMALSFLLRSSTIALTGIMADGWGLRTTFLICAILCFLSIPMVFLLPQRYKVI